MPAPLASWEPNMLHFTPHPLGEVRLRSAAWVFETCSPSEAALAPPSNIATFHSATSPYIE
jgi:hypothetical protein